MGHSRVTVYYATGTGNGFRVAQWIADQARRVGIRKRVVAIEAARPDDQLSDHPDQLLVMVLPTHGFTAPWHVIRFAWQLPRRRARAVCVATRAGLVIGGRQPPGLAGTAALLIALILALKGYAVRGTMSVNMPSNWMSLHPALRPQSIQRVLETSQARVDRFARQVIDGRRWWLTGNNLYELVGGLVLLPASALYLSFARFFLAKLFFANNRCTTCGLCVRACPVGAIEMRGPPDSRRPFWSHRCESCMRCMGYCPRTAIEAGHSWGIVLTLTTSVPAIMYLLAHWSQLAAGTHAPHLWASASLARVAVESVLFYYPSLIISYLVFDALIRVPTINTLFTYTTLTHFYRRYHEPGTRLNEIVVPAPDRAQPAPNTAMTTERCGPEALGAELITEQATPYDA